MFNLRTRRRGTVTSRLLVMLAVLALAGTACSDLEGALPIDVPEAADEAPADDAVDEAPAEDGGDAAGEDAAGDAAADEGDDAADEGGDDAAGEGEDAAGGDAAADDGAAADGGDAAEEAPVDDGAAEDTGVDPITADDVREVCADPDASAVTAEELAPLVNLTPETFEALACSAVS